MEAHSYGVEPVLHRHTDSEQLYTAYRPMRFSELYGPAVTAAETVVNSLVKHGRVLAQKAWLISGPPSSGKTTLAMIMAMAMNCLDPQLYKDTKNRVEPCGKCVSCRGIIDRGLLSRHSAFLYYNVASMRKEDIVEVIKQDMETGSSLEGRHKFVVFEEGHNLTKQQKEALLKPVENTLRKVYLLFLTTEPEKLTDNRAMRGRLTPLKIGYWSEEDLIALLKDITQQEYNAGRAPFIEEEGLQRIVDVSEEDARIAISNLQLVLDGVIPGKGDVVTANEVIPVLGQPIEHSDDFKQFFTAVLDVDYKKAIDLLDAKFDRVPGTDARLVAVALIKYLRRVVYSQNRKGNHRNAMMKLAQLYAFTNAFWKQVTDDFTALTVATFAALEAGRKAKQQ